MELYWYTHQENRSLCQNLVLLAYSVVLVIAIPIYIVVLVNDLLISVYFLAISCISDQNLTGKSKVAARNGNGGSKSSGTIIRCMSFNIQNGTGMDGKIDLDRTVRIVQNVKPNILCMQEVEKHSSLYQGNQTKDIASKVNMKYIAESDVREQYWGGIYGDSIVSQYPISETIKYNMPRWKFRLQRKIIGVKLNISQETSEKDKNDNEECDYIWVVNTHLQNDVAFDQSYYQLKHLVKFCDKIVDACMNDDHFVGLIACGDFNLPSFSSAIQYLRTKMVDCVDGATYPSKKPIAQIDHIFLHKKSKMSVVQNKCKVIPDAVASDHCAIVATFCC